MRREVISTEAGLIAIREEWWTLWTRCPYASPFQTPEWLIPWWQSFGHGALRVLILRSEGGPAGIFPFLLSASPRKLLLMGQGISDYLDILAHPDHRSEVMAAMFDWLAARSDEWEIGDFQEVRDESPLYTAIVPRTFIPGVAPSSVCPVCTLPATAEEFHAKLSKRQRRHIRNAFRKAEERYRIGLSAAREQTLGASLDDLFRLHASRWNERALPGVLSDARIYEFHRRAAGGLLRRKLLYLYRLTFDGKTVAAVYAIRANTCMYGYIGGFDPEFREFSPGMIALDLIINDSIRNGIREFDFLRGGEMYKYSWGAENQWTHRLTFRHSNPHSEALGKEAYV